MAKYLMSFIQKVHIVTRDLKFISHMINLHLYISICAVFSHISWKPFLFVCLLFFWDMISLYRFGACPRIFLSFPPLMFLILESLFLHLEKAPFCLSWNSHVPYSLICNHFCDKLIFHSHHINLVVPIKCFPFSGLLSWVLWVPIAILLTSAMPNTLF